MTAEMVEDFEFVGDFFKKAIPVFDSTGECLIRVGTSDLCTHDQNGTEVDDLNFPFKIDIEPQEIPDFNMDETYGSMEELLKKFEEIPVGAVIYKLRAFESPEDTKGTIIGIMIIIYHISFDSHSLLLKTFF